MRKSGELGNDLILVNVELKTQIRRMVYGPMGDLQLHISSAFACVYRDTIPKHMIQHVHTPFARLYGLLAA